MQLEAMGADPEAHRPLRFPATRSTPARYSCMQWFNYREADQPGGVLELPPEVTPSGLALELHLPILGERTPALWLLEDGRVLGEAVVGRA